MRLTSTAFADGGEIPTRFTIEGKDVSPPLAWSEVPDRAKSLALIVDDPDAPTGHFVHWIVFDLAPAMRELIEGVRVPSSRHGVAGGGRATWVSPAPPRGRHRYVFKLYALDRPLGLSRPNRQELERAMTGHI